jgi:hypothetical protein
MNLEITLTYPIDVNEEEQLTLEPLSNDGLWPGNEVFCFEVGSVVDTFFALIPLESSKFAQE